MTLSDPLGALMAGGPKYAAMNAVSGSNAVEKLNQVAKAIGYDPIGALYKNDSVTYHEALMTAVEPPYYTGAQVQVVIGTTFMVNAIDLTWNENREHTPYFGYCSKEYDYVFEGKGLVQGALVLNLLDNRLLDLVCDKAYPASASQSTADTVREALAGGKEYAGVVIDRLLVEGAKTGYGGTLPSMLDGIQATSALRAEASPKPAAAGSGGSTANAAGAPPSRLALDTLRWLKSRERFGIELRCNVGDPVEMGQPWAKRRASVYETVRGVIFTGENRALRVSTEVIAQAYTFFARGVDRSPR